MPQRCFLQRASISIKYSVSLRGQGFALGSVLQGIAVDETGHFIGAIWDWLSGQSVCSRFDANPGLSPLIWTILIFLFSFIGLGLIVFPYIIPVQITIYKSAAAPVRWYLCWFFIGFLSQLCWLTTSINTWFFGARLPAVNMGSDNFSG